ncbi:lysostaphin resistance A-like protein [Falsihalocynthiibacter sp. SS001]|uniref:CPBP family intramembrane glutamic endopeptidase n=1 Tax=Falsihalocynthiibacter sp. SS001 TaxID=3349698 RepID=UPI0036D36E7B
MSYAPHAEFIAPARAKSEVWRTIVGMGLCFAVYAISIWLFFSPIFDAPPSTEGATAFSPVKTMAVLYSFLCMILGPAVTVWILHNRKPLTLFGDVQQIWPYFWRAVKAMLFLHVAIIFLPPYGGGENVEVVKNLSGVVWLYLLPLSLLGLLIQTSAEEILFRGYLQQQIAARFSSRWMWMGITALLFGLGHYDTNNGANAWMIVVWAGMFSLAASDLVARTGNLGAAIGLHFVNNAFGMLIVAYPGEMSGLALYVLPEGIDNFAPTSVEIMQEFAMLAVSWLAIRVGVRR